MAWYDMFRVNKFKRELAQCEARYQELLKSSRRLQAGFKVKYQKLLDSYRKLEEQVSTLEAMEALGLKDEVDRLTAEKQNLDATVGSLRGQISAKESEIIQLDETILLQSFGLYETRYDLEDSSMYKARLDKIRDEQKQMTKNDTAIASDQKWTINGSATEGRKMIKDYVKLILRSFNNECDATIVKAKYNNVDSLEKKIKKAAETLNKLGARMSIFITEKYINLKIQELYLAYEYELKKQDEKEEQRRIKEQMREEAKALREIEEEKKKLEKEATHFQQAITQMEARLEQAETEEDRQCLEEERQKIMAQLEKVHEDIASNEKREKNTRAGYVYIISNIGSFGEDVYKIGMTKRLEPQDRIDELGDASVPYRFDVHAMIFSDDAPTLESALHNAFANRKLNLVNTRREFFNVTLREIEHVVKDNFNKPVEFTLMASAEEYRRSEAMRKRMKQGTPLETNQPQVVM